MPSYVDENAIDPNLVCAICKSPMTTPVMLQQCRHAFCRGCITAALTHTAATCPLDRRPCSVADIVSVPLLVERMLDELSVRCSYHANGCVDILQRQHSDTHAASCAYADMRCLWDACDATILRRDWEAHISSCVYGRPQSLGESLTLVSTNVLTHSRQLIQGIAAGPECAFASPRIRRRVENDR
jgi:hypothetical protein